jgi:hypothetical protein
MTFETFESWAVSVNRLCVDHLACSWAELAGDPEPLLAAFSDGESPEAFVARLRDKFDLEWLRPLNVPSSDGHPS